MDLKVDSNFYEQFENSLLDQKKQAPWNLFKMAYQAAYTTRSKDFNGLQALKHVTNINFMPHQLKSAHTVLEKMDGRAILADEVGLGKTIEAGLILKEYMVRGLVKKALILVPASLVNQWVSELNEKFLIPAVAYRKRYNWEQIDIVVSSIDTAKRSPHNEEILDIQYDFLLIDEAHKLKNHKTKNYDFVRAIQKKYCLLLTATPIQNQLIEIFNLVSILRPGLLGNLDQFVKKYGRQKHELKNNDYLKKLIQTVMIRHTRKQTALSDTKRNIKTIWIEFSKEEKETYELLSEASVTLSLPAFSRITFLRELCSSREALYLSLKKQNDQHYQPIINSLEQLPQHTKAIELLKILEQIGDDKVIIFTEYRATQVYLQWFLQQNNITSVPFRGGFKAGKKDWMRSLFKDHAQVLIATEAAGEGINLQFCNHLINYDLPWNPMRLEQRIGRIHRYGQEKDVNIYNFAIKETIEEHIMKILYEKIGLFEDVIGELDDILAALNINNIEKEIQQIFSEADSDGEMRIKMDNLTSIILNKHNDTQKEA